MTVKPEYAPKGAGRFGATWRTIRAKAYERDMKADARCWICGEKIDYTADPGTPYAWEPDHYLGVKRFPQFANDITNLRPSHSRCNRARGAEDTAAIRREKAAAQMAEKLGEPSQDWGI